ncbi:hypothetical protein BVRB_028510, partial [Beta vulgaris subsp. vulgaris]
AKTVERYCDLPPSLLQRAACLRASQYLIRDRIHVPLDRDAAGINSVPVSSAMALYDTNFGKLLFEVIARTRRIQLDIVGARVRRALQSNSGAHRGDSLRLRLITKSDDISQPPSLKRLTTLIEREMNLKSKYLITESMAVEFEALPVGELSSSFVAATSSGIKHDATVKYLATFWDYLCTTSAYGSLARLLATD